MPIDLHGKSYTTVAERVTLFRSETKDKPLTLETQLILQDDEKVIMKALVLDGETLLSTGYAEEVRGSSNVNKSDALENCETSAVGRCLGFLNYGSENEIASYEERADATIQQHEKQTWERWRAFTDALLENYESIMAIKNFLAEDNYDAAKEAMDELDNDDKTALRVAWTKGGVFTPQETKKLKHGKDHDVKRGDLDEDDPRRYGG